MTIYEMRTALGDTQSEFAERYNIPFPTIQRYYFTNGDSFEGIFVSPEYRERFVELADNVINYYEN